MGLEILRSAGRDQERRGQGATTFITNVALPPGGTRPVLEIRPCLRPEVAAGTYALTLEAGELTDAATSAAIYPDLAGGELVIGSATTRGCEPGRLERTTDSICGSGEPPPTCEEIEQDADFLRGDANQDGRISISDALMIRRWLFNGDRAPKCLDSADVEDNGLNDIVDPIFLLVSLFLGGPSISDPRPDAGSDPTDDDLCCASYSPVEAEVTTDTIDIGDAVARPGRFVDVPVYLTNSTPVEAYQIVLSYNPAHFEPLSNTDGIVLAGGFYEDIDENRSFRAVDNWIEAGIMAAGFLPHFTEEGFETPPGTHRLVFKIRGRVPEGVPIGTEIVLTPTSGMGDGSGNYKLLNELSYKGTARYISALPTALPGILRVTGDIIILRGDANDDNTVNIADALYVLNFLFLSGPDIVCPDAADANDDGSIDISDGVTILNALFAMGSIATPFPEPGVDETHDDLPDCPDD